MMSFTPGTDTVGGSCLNLHFWQEKKIMSHKTYNKILLQPDATILEQLQDNWRPLTESFRSQQWREDEHQHLDVVHDYWFG